MEQKIRIAHITQAMGGVKTHIKYILDYADPEKFCFEIIAPYDKDFISFAEERNIKYNVLHMERNISPVKDFVALWKIFFLLRKKGFDIVHLHSAKAGVLGRLICYLLGQRNVFTPNGYSYLGAKGTKRALFIFIESILKKFSTKLFAVSHSEANRALYELGLKEEKIVIIENTIKPFGHSACLKGRSEKILISTIGRLTAQKNLVRFVQIVKLVAEQYPHVQFRILGAGYHDDQKVEIYSLIQEYGLTNALKIIEWSYEISINDYLAETDIYVSTSIFEGLPYSILEAMSLGIPCVASVCDGNVDIIEHGKDGFLCNDTDQFKNTIFALIEDEALRQRIADAAIQKIRKKFDIRNNSLTLSNEYKKILQL